MRSRQATTRPHVSPKRRTSGVSSTQATKPLSSPVEESESVSSSESSNLRKPPFVSTKGGKLSLEAASVTEPGEAGPNGEADREKSSSVLTAEVAAPGGEKGEKTKDQLSVGAHDEGGSNEKIQRDGGKAEQAADRRTERESKPLSFCESLTSRLREKAERVLEKANAKWLEQEEHFEDLVKSRSLAAREELKVRETTLKALQGALNDKLEEQMRWRKKQLQRIRAYQERLREDAMRAGSGEKGLEDQSPETSADSSGGVKKKDKAGASREARTTLQALSSSAAASQSTKGVYRPAKTPTHAAGNASSSYGGAAPGASGSGACASPLSGKGGRSALPKGRRAGEEEKTSAASSSTSEEAERPADEERQCLADATAAQLFFLDDGEEEPGPEGENGDQETPRKKGKDGEEEERGGGRGQACATASRGERKKKEDFWTKEVVDANLKNAQQLLQEMRLVVTQLAADLEAIEASSAQKGGSEGRERKNAADAHIRTLCGALRDVAFHTRGDIERIVDEKCKIENLKLLHHQRAQTQIIQRLVVAIDAWTEQHATAYKKCEEELKIHNHHNAIREAVLTLRKGDDFTSPPEKQALERQMQEKEQSLSVKRHDVIHEALECLPASMTPEKVNRWMGRLGRIREVGEAWMRNLVGDFIDLKEIQRRRSEALIHTCSDRVEHFNARILWGACDTARAVAAQLLRPLQEQHLEELQMDLDVLASRMEERQRAEHHVCLRLLVFLSQVGSFLAAFRESHHLLNSSQRRLAMDASKAFVDANRQQAAGILALREEMKTAATLGELDALKKKAEEALRGLDGLVRAGVKRIGTLGQSFLPQTHERRRSELAKFLHLWNLAPLSEEQQKKYSALVEERGRTETNGSDGPSGSRLTDARDADGPSLPPPRALAEEKRRQESGDTEPSSHGRRAREREETHPEDASLSRGPSSPTARASPARMRSHANSGASKNLKGGEKRNENGSGRKPNSSSAHAGSSDRRPGTGGSSKEGETATGSKGSSHGGSKGDREDVRKKDKNGKRDVCDDEIDLDKDIWWTDSRGQTYRQLKTFEAMLGALVLPSSGDACALPVSPPAAPARDLPNDKKKMSSSPSSASLLLPRSLTALSASHRSVSNGRAASASRNAPLTEDGASGSPGSATQEEAEGRDEETGNPVEILLRESWKDGLTRLRAASFDFVARALDELETTATALGEAAYSTALGEMKRVLTEFDSTSATVASFSFVYKHRQQQLAAHVARLERFLQGVASAVGRQQHLLAQTEEELELLLQDMGAEQTQFQQLRLESLLTHVGGSATAVASSPSPVSPSKPLSSSVSARRASSSPGTRNGRLLFSSLSARGKEGKGDIEASPTALASGGDLEAGDGGSGDPPGASDDGLPDGRIGGCLIQQLERRRKQFVQEQDQLRKTAEAKIQFIEQSVIASLQKVHTKIQNFFSSTPPSISEKEIQEANSKRGEWTEEIEKRRDDWQARVASWKERLESTAAEGRKQMEEHFAGLEDRISRLYGLGRQHGAPKRAAVAALHHLHQQYEAAIQRCFQCIVLSTEQAARRIFASRQDLGDCSSSPSRYTSKRRGAGSRTFGRPCGVILTFFEGPPSDASSFLAQSPFSGSCHASPSMKCLAGSPVRTLERSQLGAGAGTAGDPFGQGWNETGDKMGAQKSPNCLRQAASWPAAGEGVGEESCPTACTTDGRRKHSCSASLGRSRSTDRGGPDTGATLASHSFLSVDLLKPHERNALSFTYHVRTALDDPKYKRFISASSSLPVKTHGITQRTNNGQTGKHEALSQGVFASAVSRPEGEVRVSIAQEIRAGYALAGSIILVLCQRLQCLRPSRVSFVDEGAEQVLQGLPLLQDHWHPSAEETWSTGKCRENPHDRKNPREGQQGGPSGENRRKAAAVSASVNTSTGSAKGSSGGAGLTLGRGDLEPESNAEQVSRETVEAVARTSMLECLLGSVTSLPVSYAAAVEEIEKEFRCKAATAVVCASSTGGGASSVGRGNGRNDGLPTATGGGVPAGKDIESPVYVDHFAQYLRTQAEANRQKLVAVIRFFCRIVREELFPTAVCGIFLDLGRALQDQLEALDIYLRNSKPADERLSPTDMDFIRKLERQWKANLLNLDAQLKCIEDTGRLRYNKHTIEQGAPVSLKKPGTTCLSSLLKNSARTCIVAYNSNIAFFFRCWSCNRELCSAEENRCEQVTALVSKVCKEAASQLNASSAFITNGCIGHFEFLVTVLDRLPQLADFLPLDGYGRYHRGNAALKDASVGVLFQLGARKGAFHRQLETEILVISQSQRRIERDDLYVVVPITSSHSLFNFMFFVVSDIPFSSYSMPRRSLKRRLRKKVSFLQCDDGAVAQVPSGFSTQNSPAAAYGNSPASSAGVANSKVDNSYPAPSLESDGSNYFTKQWRGLPIQPWSLVNLNRFVGIEFSRAIADATYGGIAAEANATEKWSAPVLPLLYPPKSATPVDNTPLSASSVNAREKAVTQQAHRHQPVGKPAAGGATAVRTDPLDDQNGSEILFSKTINSFSEHRNSRAAGVDLPRSHTESKTLDPQG
uniref:DUF4455 domain-containing protein n=1 Tax=Neospora caninum (strain Liverpool) TaxID=572307 RepID=A0A0F7UGJ7_NEOCL|nr:TPA: hypothetical protein BN1204_034710 [Neospora caninum Liverpool]